MEVLLVADNHQEMLALAQQLGHSESVNFWQAVIDGKVLCTNQDCQTCVEKSAAKTSGDVSIDRFEQSSALTASNEIKTIHDLDDDIIARIISSTGLRFNEIVQLESVCKRWKGIIRDLHCKRQRALSLGSTRSSCCRYSIDKHRISRLDWVGSIRCHAETKERMKESEVVGEPADDYKPVFSIVNPFWFDDILARCPRITTLSLSPDSASTEVLYMQQYMFEIIAERCGALQHLEFGYCFGLSRQRQPLGMNLLAPCAQLKHLYFSYTDVDDEALSELLKNCPQIEILTLYGAGNPEQYVSGSFLKSLPNALLSLDLITCRSITLQGIKSLSDAKCQFLQHLHIAGLLELDDQFFNAACHSFRRLKSLSIGVIDDFSEALSSLTELEILHLMFRQKAGVQLYGPRFETTLRCLRKLKVVEFWNGAGNDTTLLFFAESLPNLEEINFEKCLSDDITDNGIINYVSRMKNLKRFGVCSSGLTDYALRSLMINCVQLREICFNNCPFITNNSIAVAIQVCQHRQRFYRLHLECKKCAITFEDVKDLLDDLGLDCLPDNLAVQL